MASYAQSAQPKASVVARYFVQFPAIAIPSKEKAEAVGYNRGESTQEMYRHRCIGVLALPSLFGSL